MSKFVMEKMLHKKWMCICLLIGNVLLIAVTLCNPLYYHGALNRMLQTDLESVHTDSYNPGVVSIVGSSSKDAEGWTSSDFAGIKLNTGDEVLEDMASRFDLPVKETMAYTGFPRSKVSAMSMTKDFSKKAFVVANLNSLEKHVDIISGKEFSKDCDTSKPIECMISERTMLQQELMVGQEITLETDVDTQTKKSLTFKIVGIFTAKEKDSYWMEDCDQYKNQLFVSDEMKKYCLENVKFTAASTTTRKFYTLFDTTKINDLNYQDIMKASNRYTREAGRNEQIVTIKFLKMVETYAQNRGSLRTIMLTLQVPLFLLLALFIYMVSKQMLSMEENEIAMLKSRGSSRKQIIGIYVMQSLLLNAMAAVVGIPLAFCLCRLIGASNSFMQFVHRSPLEVHFSWDIVWFFLGAVTFSTCVMIGPVIRLSRLTIVESKQGRGKVKKPLYLRIGADFILLAVSGYAYYSFYKQKDILPLTIAKDGNIDPMFLLAASVFIIGCGIFTLRILPKLVWLIFMIGKRFWKPELYASFLQIIRTNSKQGGISLFLVITLALGIFNMTMARTINQNKEEQIRYANGAEIILQEEWSSNKLFANIEKNKFNTDIRITYTEPDYEKYDALAKQVDTITKVYKGEKTKVSIFPTWNEETQKSEGGQADITVTMLGVEPEGYGKTCWTREDLSDTHWYTWLNKLAETYDGFLISKNIAEKYDIHVGQGLNFQLKDEMGRYIFEDGYGTVVGIVDYWPTLANKTESLNKKGKLEETDNYFVIGNLNSIMSQTMVRPYSIYINPKDGNTQAIYDFIEKENISLEVFTDTENEIAKTKNDPVYQATNGILTISFLIIMVLCATGFLIYWILSIRSRELLFGIYRAMGLSRRELRKMLINEHIFSTFLSIAVGILVGFLAAKYFVPMIEITYLPGSQMIPLRVVKSVKDMVKLSAVILSMVLICIVILLKIISRLKISQALKLGED